MRGRCPHTRLSDKSICGRHACDTDPQSSSPVATLLGCAKCVSCVAIGFCQQQEELRLELWCTETALSAWGKCGFVVVIIVLRGATLLNLWHCWVRDGWAVSLYCLLSRLVRCLGCLLQIQPGSGSLCIKGVGKGGSGRFDQSAQRRQQRLLRQDSSCSCIRMMSRSRGLAAMRAPRCAGRATSRALLNTPE